MLSDPFLVILCLILLVMLVQLWSVQRVEKHQKEMKAHIITRDKVIDGNTASAMQSESIHRSIAVSLHRLDTLLVDKGISDKPILSDLIIRDAEETTGALPPVT